MALNPSDIIEYQNDHDLLIELRTEMRGMRNDLRSMSETTVKTVGDHETRIRLIETGVTTIEATARERESMTRLGGAILIFVVALAEFLINRFWH